MKLWTHKVTFVSSLLCILSIEVANAQQYFVDETSTRLPSISDMSYSQCLGDVDNDGDPDIYISNISGSDYPNLLLIHAVGDSFVNDTSERLPYIGGYRNSRSTDMGDVEGDGDLDIIVANSESDNLLLINDGIGFFSLAGTDRLPSDREAYSKDAQFGDIDGDKDLDLLVVNFNWTKNYLYINDGDGYFTLAEDSRFPSGYYNSNEFALGDVDGDLDLDVVIANNTGHNNQVMINDGTGQFADETSYRLPDDLNQSNGVALGDVDGDGDLDIVVGNGWFPGDNEIFINDGSGVFTDETPERLPSDGATTVGVNVIDVDNDRDLDIIFANYASEGLSTRLLVNNGGGYFTDETSIRYPSLEEEDRDIAFFDIDKDGDADLFVANIGLYPEGGQNRLLINVSIPDSFPPVVPRTTVYEDTVPSGSPYIITTTVWDNISIPFELSVSLYYSVDGGDYTSEQMRYCGGYLWREAIPEQEEGTIVRYYVRVLDLMENEETDPFGAPDSVFEFVAGGVGIGDEDKNERRLPLTFSLAQNYPNPFNPSTVIRYSIPDGKHTKVSLVVYNLHGKLVRKLVDGIKFPGIHTVNWDGRDGRGIEVASGVYFYRLQAGDFTFTKKMTLLR